MPKKKGNFDFFHLCFLSYAMFVFVCVKHYPYRCSYDNVLVYALVRYCHQACEGKGRRAELQAAPRTGMCVLLFTSSWCFHPSISSTPSVRADVSSSRDSCCRKEVQVHIANTAVVRIYDDGIRACNAKRTEDHDAEDSPAHQKGRRKVKGLLIRDMYNV